MPIYYSEMLCFPAPSSSDQFYYTYRAEIVFPVSFLGWCGNHGGLDGEIYGNFPFPVRWIEQSGWTPECSNTLSNKFPFSPWNNNELLFWDIFDCFIFVIELIWCCYRQLWIQVVRNLRLRKSIWTYLNDFL